MSRPLTAPAASTVGERALWKQAALPAEHGGWGLTLEPVLLGLLVAPSWPGAALGVAALLAFLVRTPLKLALIDKRRNQWAARSRLAARIAAVESTLIVAGAAFALYAGGWRWLVAVAVALPLVAVEMWFDIRSRGRRLVPELCGAAGISAAVAAFALAAGKSAGLAVALWMVLAARAVGAIPFVRVQIMRLRRGTGAVLSSDLAQLAAVVLAGAAAVVDRRLLAGAAGVLGLAALQVVWVRRTPTAPKVLGLRQMALGFALVAVTAAGAWIS